MRHLSLCSTLFPYTTLFRSNLGVDWRNIYYGWFFNSSGIVSRATSWDFFIPVSQRAIARKSSRFFLIEPNREHYPFISIFVTRHLFDSVHPLYYWNGYWNSSSDRPYDYYRDRALFSSCGAIAS